jgi:hypothetical protein
VKQACCCESAHHSDHGLVTRPVLPVLCPRENKLPRGLFSLGHKDSSVCLPHLVILLKENRLPARHHFILFTNCQKDIVLNVLDKLCNVVPAETDQNRMVHYKCDSACMIPQSQF